MPAKDAEYEWVNSVFFYMKSDPKTHIDLKVKTQGAEERKTDGMNDHYSLQSLPRERSDANATMPRKPAAPQPLRCSKHQEDKMRREQDNMFYPDRS